MYPDPVANYEEIQRLREEYESILDEAESHRTAYHQAIRKAYLAGASLGDIADQLGLSRQRVHEIVGKEPATRRHKRKKILGSAGILSVAALAGLGAWFFISYERSQSIPASPQTRDCSLPCIGWRYHAAYRTAGGDIAAVLAQKDSVPGNPLVGGAYGIVKARNVPSAQSQAALFSQALMPGRGRPSVQLPKDFDLVEITSDPRIRELMLGDLDDFYIANHHIQRSRRQLALGIAWGIIVSGGFIALIVWNVATRTRIHPRSVQLG